MQALSQTAKTARIRDLNDAFRRTFAGGKVTMTAGVDELLVLCPQSRFGELHGMKGPYSSERSVALMIARELIKEIVKRDTQTKLPG